MQVTLNEEEETALLLDEGASLELLDAMLLLELTTSELLEVITSESLEGWLSEQLAITQIIEKKTRNETKIVSFIFYLTAIFLTEEPCLTM